MCKLIGDKNNFGFEYEISPSVSHVMGNMRLWIEGRYIGSFDDTNILPTIIHQFEGLEEFNLDGCKFQNMGVHEIYDLIISDSIPDSYNYLFSPGEAFDDFIIIAFVCNGEIVFIWSLVENPFFEYSDYPKGIQSARVPVDVFKKNVRLFVEIISNQQKRLKEE
ncbi:MAG: hypothetical protein GY746_00250 [Gammaproteobacteria bacterium]|nr:hypothetical protein [Gammaproteobacteria bacterium]MCP4298734.1 hypothetical protein [Pseudomonadota bacterium]